ncbi:hypothetical protein GPECTOR_9g451 [Gonium pectorale]|uniref:SET domain-containing protein n=1 Tax=Gonium pectorale TaxID=33097 RepID=A0A150GRH4_GONPE|nr:hypothetical protein GPECTOR_9g451 [Gonium pectorale]|eukprot:KXZ52407.1 hypothetical protein GPECTOR_9g451 [Gonium pectorale]
MKYKANIAQNHNTRKSVWINIDYDRLYTQPSYNPGRQVGPLKLKQLPGRGRGLVAEREVPLADTLLVCEPVGAALTGPAGSDLLPPQLAEELGRMQAEGRLGPADRARLRLLYDGSSPDSDASLRNRSASLDDFRKLEDKLRRAAEAPKKPKGRGFGAPAAAAAGADTGAASGIDTAALGEALLTAEELSQLVLPNAWGNSHSDPGVAALRSEPNQAVVGVWPEFALLNHSCAPNTVVFAVGQLLLVQVRSFSVSVSRQPANPHVAEIRGSVSGCGAALLRAHYERRAGGDPGAAQAALDRLFRVMAERRLALSFEMVTGSHGHHGQLPAAEYLVTTAAHTTHPATGGPAFLPWLPFLELCAELGLPLNDTWLFAGGPMAAAARPGAARVIPAGSEISTSYLADLAAAPLERRREWLRGSYGFECGCERCKIESSVPAAVSSAVAAAYEVSQDEKARELLTRGSPSQLGRGSLRPLEEALDGAVSRLESAMEEAGLEAQTRTWLRASAYDAYRVRAMIRDLPAGGGGGLAGLFGGGAGAEDAPFSDPVAPRELADMMDAIAPGTDPHLYLSLEALTRGAERYGRTDPRVVEATKACLHAHILRYGRVSDGVLRKLLEARMQSVHYLGRLTIEPEQSLAQGSSQLSGPLLGSAAAGVASAAQLQKAAEELAAGAA